MWKRLSPKRLISVAVMLTALCLAVPDQQSSAGPGPSPRDKCPVCGMFVAKFPEWVASMDFKNGSRLYFDGAKDLFLFHHNPSRYLPKASSAAIVSLTARDYYTLKEIDAATAYFVVGSNVLGPMGKELIPFGKEPDARSFMKDHSGIRILKYGDITPSLLKTLE